MWRDTGKSRSKTCYRNRFFLANLIILLFHNSTCWIAPPAAAKEAASANADFVADNSIKIVQVFQGLNCSPTGGISFDSDLARTVATTSQSLVFVTPSGGRFGVKVQAIAPKKTEHGKAQPLPRIVSYRNQTKTGFGLPFSQVKKVLQGGRGVGPNLTTPICDPDGGNVNSSARNFATYNVPESLKRLLSNHNIFWKPENVREAGPPDSATV